jgi:hypothetical protein
MLKQELRVLIDVHTLVPKPWRPLFAQLVAGGTFDDGSSFVATAFIDGYMMRARKVRLLPSCRKLLTVALEQRQCVIARE